MKKDKIASMYKACSAEITSRTNEIQHLLLGEGNFDAKVMIVGEVPSSKEEEYGQNILEDDRDKLLKILGPLGLNIEDVYFTHLMKYRPYRINSKGRIVSRSPEKEELEFFIPYLEKEISLVAPKLIITLGNGPLGWLSKDFSMKVNLDEDQLLVIGVLGKSYKLYPILHPSQRNFDKSIEKFMSTDLNRIKTMLYGEQSDFFSPSTVTKSNEPQSETLNQKEALQKEKPNEHKDEEEEGKKQKDLKKRVYNKIEIQPSTQDGRSYITMIYGGEGYADDPVLIAMERIASVLAELGMGMHRIDLYKGNILLEKVFEYIHGSKGLILATNVEWFGIGHRMQQFLDDCFYRGDQSYFKDKPLLGLVFTRHGFEKDAYNYLRQSWEVLGGFEGLSLTASIATAAALETNFDWLYAIDKKAEAFFRLVKQEKGRLPSSVLVEKIAIETPVTEKDIDTLSKVKAVNSKKAVSQSGIIGDYDAFVEKQQKDIQEISSLFKKKLSTQSLQKDQSIPRILKDAYKNKGEIQTNIQFLIDDQMKENTVIELNNQYIRAYYGQIADVNVTVSGSKEVFMKILKGKLTMQRAFMTGEIKAKGDFTILYKFEQYFDFTL